MHVCVCVCVCVFVFRDIYRRNPKKITHTELLFAIRLRCCGEKKSLTHTCKKKHKKITNKKITHTDLLLAIRLRGRRLLRA